MTPVPPSLGFVEGVAQPLEKRFEVLKDVGDGSFGSVVLARVRGTRNKVITRLAAPVKTVGCYQVYEKIFRFVLGVSAVTRSTGLCLCEKGSDVVESSCHPTASSYCTRIGRLPRSHNS